MDFNNIFENQIFSLHIYLCTPKSIAFFEMWLLNANLNCTYNQNLRECPTFSHCALANSIHNIYTEKSENYLNRKNYGVTTFVKDWATGELHVKIQIPYNQLASFLTNLSTQNVQTSTSILSEDKKKRLFPKTPGKIADIIKKKPELMSLIIDWYNIVPYFIEVFTLHSLHFQYHWFPSTFISPLIVSWHFWQKPVFGKILLYWQPGSCVILVFRLNSC